MKNLWQTKIHTNAFVFWGLVFLSSVSVILSYNHLVRERACSELIEFNKQRYKSITPNKPREKFIKLQRGMPLSSETLKFDVTRTEPDLMSKAFARVAERNKAFKTYTKMSSKERLSLPKEDQKEFRRRELELVLWKKTCPKVDFRVMQSELDALDIEALTK